MYINGAEYPIAAGQAVFAGSKALHLGVSADSSPCRFFALVFAPEFLGAGGDDDVFKRFVLPVLSGKITLPAFYSGKEEWERELVQRARAVNSLNSEAIYCKELSIKAEMLELWRLAVSHSSAADRPRAAAADEMVRAMEFIRAEYASPLTLKIMADRVNMSQGYFCRRFSAIMHMTPFEYLLRTRIDNSCRLLQTTDLPIGEVASRCGFNGFSYFSKKFAAAMGSTPLEYRKLHRIAKDSADKN